MNIYQVTYHRVREVVDEVVTTVQAPSVNSAIERAQERVEDGNFVVTRYEMDSDFSDCDFDLQYVDNLGQVGSEELKENMV